MLGFYLKRKNKNKDTYNNAIAESIQAVEDFHDKIASLEETLYNIQTVVANIAEHRKSSKNEI